MGFHGDPSETPRKPYGPPCVFETDPQMGVGAGDEARTRDPYLGKVRFSFCIREGLKRHLNEYLPSTSTELDAEHTGSTLTTPASTPATNDDPRRVRSYAVPNPAAQQPSVKAECAGSGTEEDNIRLSERCHQDLTWPP
jgi:hypothetical protein